MAKRTSSMKLTEFDRSGEHVMLLATLHFGPMGEQPSSLVVRIVVDGEIEDEAEFILDWNALDPKTGSDEITFSEV